MLTAANVDHREGQSKMHGGFVTTYGQACGIATYSEELLTELSKIPQYKFLVLAPAELGACIRPVPNDVPAVPAWQRRDPPGVFGANLLRYAVGDGARLDFMHFQHEDGLFVDPRAFLQALYELRASGVATVVTLHTVRWTGSWQATGFYRDVVGAADAVVVHTPEALASLAVAAAHDGAEGKLHLIPHGTPARLRAGDRARGLDLLGVPKMLWNKILDRAVSVGLVHGFMHPGKNIIGTIRAFAEGVSRNLIRRSLLVISGEPADPIYYNQLVNAAAETGYFARIHVHTGFIAAAEIHHIMALADYGVLNTMAWTLSASGAAHVYAAHGVPLAVAVRPIYTEAIQGGAIPYDLDAGDNWRPTLAAIDAIGALAASRDVREVVGAKIAAWGAQTAWPKVAEAHRELYEHVVARVRAKAAKPQEEEVAK